MTDINRQYEGLDVNARRELYANALNKSLETFVSYSAKDVDDVISNGLKPIAAAVGLDRVIVFRVKNRSKLLTGEKYRWDRILGGTAPIDNMLRELPVTPPIMRWFSTVSSDSCISLKRSDLKEDEAAFLVPRGVMSILIIPVFTENEFWGVVTCHDNTKERDFDKDCVALLRSTARLCVSTIIREEKSRMADVATRMLKRREKMTSVLNKVSLIFLSEKEKKTEDTMAAGVSIVADTADIDRLVLYRNSMKVDGLHMSQVYRWDRKSGGSTALIEAFTDVSYKKFIPNWESYLAEGNSVNDQVRLMHGQETEVLKSFGFLSVSAIPIHINNAFWGFALFGDTQKERYFEDDVIELMRSSAFLFANAFIRSEVDYDALTGLHNRRAFDEHMKRIMRLLSRSGSLLSILMIDIDFFKRFNDTYGHVEGDKCLKIVAQTLLKSVTRADDFVVRYGGEEFIVVLPNTDEKGAEIVAKKLLENIQKHNIPHKHNDAANCVTISIGAATSKVTRSHIADDFVKKADYLLYKSKNSGRNKYSFERF